MTSTRGVAVRSRRLTKIAAIVVTLVAAAAACGGDSSTAPSIDPAGVYTLERVEQTSVPVQVYRGPYYHPNDARSYEDFVVTITGGTLQLDAAGTYHSTLNYRAMKDGVEEVSSIRAWGTYTVSGSEIYLVRDNGFDTGDGTVGKGTVTLALDVVDKGATKAYMFVK
jgi:hypothetical protein